MSSNHNANQFREVHRVREEHPGEKEVIFENRVIGSIAVTRGKRARLLDLHDREIHTQS